MNPQKEKILELSEQKDTSLTYQRLPVYLPRFLGFRNTTYRLNLTSEAIISEGICMTSGPRYGFISLNDKQTKNI